MMKLIVGILLVGVDLGAYYYEESRRRARRMKELEAEEPFQTAFPGEEACPPDHPTVGTRRRNRKARPV